MDAYESASVAAKEIVIKLIEKEAILLDDYPGVTTYIDCVCAAYKKIFDATRNPSK